MPDSHRMTDSATASPEAWRCFVGGGNEAPSPVPFCARPAEELARNLLGAFLVSEMEGVTTVGRIVETEAYVGPHDPACHAARRIGRTRRNRSMFGPPGRAYVYFIYGMHWCFNVVSGERGDPQAVLVRAVEPLVGREGMARRRGRSRDLTNGPARLCQALGIAGELDGHDLSRPPLRLIPPSGPPTEEVGVSGRIGIREARDWPLRFYLRDHGCVSCGPHLADASWDRLASDPRSPTDPGRVRS
jgi:DNA-3-methyladenine glycosylase